MLDKVLEVLLDVMEVLTPLLWSLVLTYIIYMAVQ